MHKLPQPVKLWYYCPMFRYEKPQAGRYREHYQIGAEAIGSADPAVDAEVDPPAGAPSSPSSASRASRLNMNSMGDPQCRPAYVEKLREYLRGHEAELCGDCLERVDINPLRTFDCKVDELPRGARRGAAHQRPPVPGVPRALRRRARAGPARPASSPTSTSGSCAVWTTTRARPSSSTPTASAPRAASAGAAATTASSSRSAGQPTPGVGWGSGLERIALAMREPLAVPARDRRLRRRLQRRCPRGRPSPSPTSCAVPACRPSWTSPGAAPRASSSRRAAAAPASPCCSAWTSWPRAPCGSRTWPAAGKRTSPPPTSPALGRRPSGE